ncbi:uncharacterized protein [Misgurnus anguillicaudatus]|uniref:uncharacterized protein isoform X1 n=1 Tax=Misgurnus anguillicaudatus TaxID=75329 RepID=UPI003CCF39BE
MTEGADLPAMEAEMQELRDLVQQLRTDNRRLTENRIPSAAVGKLAPSESLSHGSGGGSSDSSNLNEVSCLNASKLVGSCPSVSVLMGGVRVSCLLDTGSMVSTVAESFFFQHFNEQLHSCNWLQLKAANGLDIPYLGYAEVNVEVLGKVIPNKGILIVKDTPDLQAKTNMPGVLGMNIISECYDLLFSQHGDSLFSLPCVQQAPKVWQQALQFCHDTSSSVRPHTGIARVRGASLRGVLSLWGHLGFPHCLWRWVPVP